MFPAVSVGRFQSVKSRGYYLGTGRDCGLVLLDIFPTKRQLQLFSSSMIQLL